MYLLKLALRPWRIAPLSQVSSAVAVGFLLLMIGFLYWIQLGLKTVVIRLKNEQVIIAYIDTNFPDSEESKLMDSINNAIGNHKGIEVQKMNSAQFIKTMKTYYPDLGRELEELGQETQFIVPRYISVSGILSESIFQKIKNLPGIESVENSKDKNHAIIGTFSALRWVAKILMLGIILALMTGLIHLSRLNAYLHQDALSVLKFWGAGTSTLVGPGLISGLLVGVVGGGLAWLGWVTAGTNLMGHMRSLNQLLHGLPVLTVHSAWILFPLGSCIGVISGVIGSFYNSNMKKEKIL